MGLYPFSFSPFDIQDFFRYNENDCKGETMIKLVAFDMDGSFLSPDNDYDRERFARIFPQLMARGIKVVAISGNQYHQIKTFFSDYLDEMVIVSEAGSMIFEKGVRIFEQTFDRSVVDDLLSILQAKGFLAQTAITGLKAIYFEKKCDPDFRKIILKHNFKYVEVDSLMELPDDAYCMLTMNLPGQEIDAIVDELNSHTGQAARAMSSGFNFIDIVLPHVNKGVALDWLGEKWGIQADEMIAFGDSDNDLEMLQYVGHSYAMANAGDRVKAAAKYQAPANKDSGVLQIIEEVVLGTD